ncbi:MAG TPA: hypothetical protein VE844_19705, partial [Gammaproteobacteria bacterium]|nr:hypothetical protein [Gammaproteobacteria bacterium]
GAASPGTTVTLDAGSYSVDEVELSGYTKSLGTDCSGSIAAGETKTCTITNDDQPQQAQLTVTKNVVNDNGGSAAVGDFPLFVDSGSVISGAQNTFTTGPHTVSETNQPGYTATIGGDCAADGSITLNPGDVKTCTITNNDNPPEEPPPPV